MPPERPEIVGGPPFGPKLPDFNIQISRNMGLAIAAVLLVGAFLVLGKPMYTVAPDEEGVVLTFGRYTKTTRPGLHFKFPWPIQTVERPKVSEVKRLEFGFRSMTRGNTTTYQDFSDSIVLLHEAQMLTGDENVVNVSMVVQYRINNSLDYLFNFESPAAVESALQDIGEAALRQAVGDRPIDHVLTTRKFEVQSEIERKMEELTDLYEMGVSIVAVQLQDVKPPRQVEASFQEVATAREQREQIINVALGYEKERIPTAEGEAERMKLEAQGYREARVAEANGDVARFKALATEYAAAPEVTRIRLYLEAMSELLPKMRITIIDEAAGVVNLKSLGGAPIPIPGITPQIPRLRSGQEGGPR